MAPLLQANGWNTLPSQWNPESLGPVQTNCCKRQCRSNVGILRELACSPHGRRRDSLHISPCGSDGPDHHLGNLEQVSNKQKWSAKCTAENAELNHMCMHRIWQDSCCHNQNSWFPASRAGPEADVALHVKEINDS